MAGSKRAIGIIRVSQTRGRKGESFHSPATQRDRIRTACEAEGFELLDIHQELDTSGGRPLAERPGLLAAVEMIEAGDADVVVAAYLDRLTRSMRVRDEVIERVEAAGGSVLAVDMGVQTNATATQWLTGTLGSAVNEFIRRTAAERTGLAQQRAINRGVPPWAGAPPGYRREVVGERVNGQRMWGPLIPDPSTAPVVAQAFESRARGATVESVRDFLIQHGIKRSFHGVQHLLASRVVLGEIHFGDYEPNLAAHPPIVDRATWDAVQAVRKTRGTRPRSNHLLARQGVLLCGTCGSRMVVGTAYYGRYPFYRCPPVGDCPKRMHISAPIAEQVVVDAVKDALQGVEGTASAERDAQEADAAFHEAQANLDSAIRAFAGLEDEGAARARLAELRLLRDQAEERANQLGGLSAAVTIRVADHWDLLTLDERRGLVRAVVAKAVVGPGRGAERISVELFGEDSASG